MVGFAVEDRDRVNGIYFVRYADPEAGSQKTGMLAKLAFWRGNDKATAAQRYQVRVVGRGDAASQVTVHLDDGKPALGETGERIARLLQEQLK